NVALALTLRAGVLASDIQPQYSAADRLPERNRYLVFEIAAWNRSFLALASASPKHGREDVPEASGSTPTLAGRSTGEIGKVEASKTEGAPLPRSLVSRSPPRKAPKSACAETRPTTASVCFRGRGIYVVRVKTDLIVDLALLGVAENVVGFGDLFELLFGLLITRIDVGMIFARKFAECLPDVIRRGVLLHA